MKKHSTISVIGCGYVGLTTAAILANCGYKVYAIEVNPTRLKSIQQGKSFFYELGIDQLLENALKQGNLIATDSYEEAVPGSSIVFSCVGTPDNPDGSSNLSYVFSAAEEAAKYLAEGSIYVQKSTVPVGTGEKIEKQFKEGGKNFRYVSNPEFLREGTAISDTLWFDRIVAGSDDKAAAAEVIEVYKSIERCRDELAKIAGLEPPKAIPEANYITTTRNSAELIKVTANAFLALKISFANSIAKLADQAGADINGVMDGVGADRRIGRAFLYAGRGYGGGCFPKDVSGLIRSAEEYGVNMEIMNAATEVNNSMPHYIINKAKDAIGGSFEGKKVAVLGLAFKAGTSDARRSPAVAIANTLASQASQITAYDPKATEEAREELDDSIKLCSSTEEAVKDADCIFIATDWPEFKEIDFAKYKAELIVDCMNTLEPSAQLSYGYLGVGLGTP
jgi:UDPglucose 6-dehydrogenase